MLFERCGCSHVDSRRRDGWYNAIEVTSWHHAYPDIGLKKNCNVCTSQLNGFYGCTQNNCPFPQQPRRDNTTSCIPGENFKSDSNDCICGLDGKPASCTRKACDQSNPSMSAKVSNTSFSNLHSRKTYQE